MDEAEVLHKPTQHANNTGNVGTGAHHKMHKRTHNFTVRVRGHGKLSSRGIKSLSFGVLLVGVKRGDTAPTSRVVVLEKQSIQIAGLMKGNRVLFPVAVQCDAKNSGDFAII